jgi:hypothetical protein
MRTDVIKVVDLTEEIILTGMISEIKSDTPKARADRHQSVKSRPNQLRPRRRKGGSASPSGSGRKTSPPFTAEPHKIKRLRTDTGFFDIKSCQTSSPAPLCRFL